MEESKSRATLEGGKVGGRQVRIRTEKSPVENGQVIGELGGGQREVYSRAFGCCLKL